MLIKVIFFPIWGVIWAYRKFVRPGGLGVNIYLVRDKLQKASDKHRLVRFTRVFSPDDFLVKISNAEYKEMGGMRKGYEKDFVGELERYLKKNKYSLPENSEGIRVTFEPDQKLKREQYVVQACIREQLEDHTRIETKAAGFVHEKTAENILPDVEPVTDFDDEAHELEASPAWTQNQMQDFSPDVPEHDFDDDGENQSDLKQDKIALIGKSTDHDPEQELENGMTNLLGCDTRCIRKGQQLYLEFQNGGRSGEMIPVSTDRRTFGRSDEADVYVPEDNTLSRLHFAFWQQNIGSQPRGVIQFLEDASNPVLINNFRIRGSEEVVPGDLITVGNTVLKVGTMQE